MACHLNRSAERHLSITNYSQCPNNFSVVIKNSRPLSMFAGISRSSKIYLAYLHCTEQVQHRSCRGQPWYSVGHFLCMWQSRPNLHINNSANFN